MDGTKENEIENENNLNNDKKNIKFMKNILSTWNIQ